MRKNYIAVLVSVFIATMLVFVAIVNGIKGSSNPVATALTVVSRNEKPVIVLSNKEVANKDVVSGLFTLISGKQSEVDMLTQKLKEAYKKNSAYETDLHNVKNELVVKNKNLNTIVKQLDVTTVKLDAANKGWRSAYAGYQYYKVKYDNALVKAPTFKEAVKGAFTRVKS